MGIEAELTKFIWYIKGLDQRQKEQPPFLESRGHRKGLELGSACRYWLDCSTRQEQE